jgi:hypothetical protein
VASSLHIAPAPAPAGDPAGRAGPQGIHRPPARIFVRPEGRRERDELFPRWMVLGAEVAAVLMLLAAAIYGPPLHACRQMSEQGQFFYGTTVGSCVRERVSTRYEAVEAYVQRVVRRL